MNAATHPPTKYDCATWKARQHTPRITTARRLPAPTGAFWIAVEFQAHIGSGQAASQFTAIPQHLARTSDYDPRAAHRPQCEKAARFRDRPSPRLSNGSPAEETETLSVNLVGRTKLRLAASSVLRRVICGATEPGTQPETVEHCSTQPLRTSGDHSQRQPISAKVVKCTQAAALADVLP